MLDFEHTDFLYPAMCYLEIDLTCFRLSELQESEQRESFISNFDLYKVMIDISLFAAVAVVAGHTSTQGDYFS